MKGRTECSRDGVFQGGLMPGRRVRQLPVFLSWRDHGDRPRPAAGCSGSDSTPISLPSGAHEKCIKEHPEHEPTQRAPDQNLLCYIVRPLHPHSYLSRMTRYLYSLRDCICLLGSRKEN